jgi:hypothetical protein
MKRVGFPQAAAVRQQARRMRSRVRMAGIMAAVRFHVAYPLWGKPGDPYGNNERDEMVENEEVGKWQA